MEEKIAKMVIYYVLSVYDDDKKNVESCIEIIKLFLAMIKNEETKLDRLLNVFPTEHPVYKLYKEIKGINNEELIVLFERCNEKFINYKNIVFNKINDDEEVEELTKKIIK